MTISGGATATKAFPRFSNDLLIHPKANQWDRINPKSVENNALEKIEAWPIPSQPMLTIAWWQEAYWKFQVNIELAHSAMMPY